MSPVALGQASPPSRPRGAADSEKGSPGDGTQRWCDGGDKLPQSPSLFPAPGDRGGVRDAPREPGMAVSRL